MCIMPVVLVATNRTWTSVNATELNDHILNDGIFEGPTYITRDEFGIPPDETFLYKSLNVHLVRDQTYSTNLKAATVLNRFVSHGYRIVSSAGSGVGTSGKARYSADVSVTDYRWMWTLVRDDMAPPPYSHPSMHYTAAQPPPPQHYHQPQLMMQNGGAGGGSTSQQQQHSKQQQSQQQQQPSTSSSTSCSSSSNHQH